MWVRIGSWAPQRNRDSENILTLSAYRIYQPTDYRYGRNAIPSPIPPFIPTTSGVITGMGITLFLALYSSLYSYNIGSYPIGYARQEAYPMDRMPAGWATAYRAAVSNPSLS